MRIVRISDRHRSGQRSASELDAALDRALEQREPGGDFEAELRAADALAGAFDPVSPPAEALVALRAAIAARKAAASRHRARRLAWQAPGAVAAATLGLLGYVGWSHHTNSGPPATAHLQNAARTLQLITDHISKVQQGVQANDPSAAQSQALSTRAALVQAQQQAVGYPADDPARDLLLNALELKIQQLDALLARLRLPPVQPLPPVQVAPSSQSGAQPQAAPASSSTTRPPGSSTTTSSSSPSSTTSTTQGGSGSGVLAAASPTDHQTGSDAAGSSSSSSTSSSTTSSSTSTSTTTTNPPPPSTTSTTAPPGP